jgi:hypothetical protein
LFKLKDVNVAVFTSFKTKTALRGVRNACGGCIINAYQFWWDKEFIEWSDSKGSKMGSKTTSLEFIGILLHVLLMPQALRKQNVVFVTDNLSCVYGWENRCVKNDEFASIMIRGLQIITAFLECNVYICHKKRCSDWETQLVDRLTRQLTTTKNDKALVNSFGHSWPSVLSDWLRDPKEDWGAATRILNYVINLIHNV